MNRLKLLRIKSGLSQNDVSRHLGYNSGQFISNWEGGRSFPPAEALKKICNLYKANYQEIASEIALRVAEKKATVIFKKYGINDSQAFEKSRQRVLKQLSQ